MKSTNIFTLEVGRMTDNELQVLISILNDEIRRRKEASVREARGQIVKLLNQISETGYTTVFTNGCDVVTYDIDTVITVE